MTELENALRSAQDEIRMLRAQKEILRAKVEMIDLFALVFRTQPAYLSQGMGIDAVWLLQKELDALATPVPQPWKAPPRVRPEPAPAAPTDTEF